MKLSVFKSGTLLCAAVFLTISCSAPPAPPEAKEAFVLEQDLWRAGASVFSVQEYQNFRRSLAEALRALDAEKAKFGWFRDYEPVRVKFRSILAAGTILLEKVRSNTSARSRALALRLDAFAERVRRIKSMTEYFNENMEVRRALAQAEIKSVEARLLVEKFEFEKAGGALNDGESKIKQAEQSVAAILARYMDRRQIERWRAWAQETISESREKESTVILVNKLERKLSVYKAGLLAGCFDIGLGRFGLSNKVMAGDEATPEGKYRIIKKYPDGPFYKAMLIDYPNEDDLTAFSQAKKSGRISRNASIGGAIEIHGGGKDSLTKGCVGLENKDMDIIFGLAEVGTSVTIVGAITLENTIVAEVKKFNDHD